MSESETTEVSLNFITTSQKSVLFGTGEMERIPGTALKREVQVSIPKALIVDYQQLFGAARIKRGQMVEFEIPVWLARDRGLI